MPKSEKSEKGEKVKLTKEQIEKQVREGKMTLDDALKLMAGPQGALRFAVAEKSGWLSIYFPGRRFPVSLPVENADQLLLEENLAKMREFIEKNRGRFKNKDKDE